MEQRIAGLNNHIRRLEEKLDAALAAAHCRYDSEEREALVVHVDDRIEDNMDNVRFELEDKVLDRAEELVEEKTGELRDLVMGEDLLAQMEEGLVARLTQRLLPQVKERLVLQIKEEVLAQVKEELMKDIAHKIVSAFSAVEKPPRLPDAGTGVGPGLDSCLSPAATHERINKTHKN